MRAKLIILSVYHVAVHVQALVFIYYTSHSVVPTY